MEKVEIGIYLRDFDKCLKEIFLEKYFTNHANVILMTGLIGCHGNRKA